MAISQFAPPPLVLPVSAPEDERQGGIVRLGLNSLRFPALQQGPVC